MLRRADLYIWEKVIVYLYYLKGAAGRHWTCEKCKAKLKSSKFLNEYQINPQICQPHLSHDMLSSDVNNSS